MIGFETIGNATLIAIDDKPILATDPWLQGGSYFGSWQLSHEIPKSQMDSIKACEFIWLSHGHPDHLSVESLQSLTDKTILLPPHEGRRIFNDLTALGLKCKELPNREWVHVSPNIKIMTICDYFQDAILLLDINGRLVINMNDASDRGWGRFLRKIISSYPKSIFLKLFGWGDVDMNNFFTEDEKRINLLTKKSIPKQIQFWAHLYGVTKVVPFSSFHIYQRKDSIWANEFVPSLSDFSTPAEGNKFDLLPAFVSYDCANDSFEEISPRENSLIVKDPAEFGDNWSDTLNTDDVACLKKYILAIESLSDGLDFITFRVGGKETVMDLKKENHKKGVVFEVPRGSLMKAVHEEVFDDLLIGNFMKTTMIGLIPQDLFQNFTPYVGKYADNGLAKSKDELKRYFASYRKRAPVEFIMHKFEKESERKFRKLVTPDSPLFQLSKRVYLRVKGGAKQKAS